MDAVGVRSTTKDLLVQLLQLRRNEKDFLLRKDDKNSKTHADNAAAAVGLFDHLKLQLTAMDQSQLVAKIDVYTGGLGVYSTDFLAMVDLAHKLGLTPDAGLEGTLRNLGPCDRRQPRRIQGFAAQRADAHDAPPREGLHAAARPPISRSVQTGRHCVWRRPRRIRRPRLRQGRNREESFPPIRPTSWPMWMRRNCVAEQAESKRRMPMRRSSPKSRLLRNRSRILERTQMPRLRLRATIRHDFSASPPSRFCSWSAFLPSSLAAASPSPWRPGRLASAAWRRARRSRSPASSARTKSARPHARSTGSRRCWPRRRSARPRKRPSRIAAGGRRARRRIGQDGSRVSGRGGRHRPGRGRRRLLAAGRARRHDRACSQCRDPDQRPVRQCRARLWHDLVRMLSALADGDLTNAHHRRLPGQFRAS